jgi:1-deoxy-D-xylulose-5-phosphate reductoisomerase
MGKKISVDSASMMNKALEVIEAHYLFKMPPEKIDVVIHPQSVIHSMVSYSDGSVLCQMGASDMRTPIAYALSYPQRMKTSGQVLDVKTLSSLTFRKADISSGSALGMAYECLRSGNMACVVLNAANEVAADLFLNEKISFGGILRLIGAVLENVQENISQIPLKTVEEIEEWDNLVRELTLKIATGGSGS